MIFIVYLIAVTFNIYLFVKKNPNTFKFNKGCIYNNNLYKIIKTELVTQRFHHVCLTTTLYLQFVGIFLQPFD